MSIHLKLALATVVWGTTPTIGRILAHYESPELLTFGRFLVASVFLYFAASRDGNIFKKFRRTDVPLYLVLGLTGICLHNILMFWGLEYANAIRASIVMGFISIMVAALEFAIFGIRLTTLGMAGIMLGLVGLSVVVSEGNLETILSGSIGFGDLLLLGSAFSWAIYSVISRPVLERVSALDLTALACISGTLLLVPFVAKDFVIAKQMLLDPAALGLLGFSGLLGSGIGYIWYYEGVKKLGSVGTVMYVNLMPVTGVVIAALTLGEVPTMAAIIGGTAVVIGVMLVNTNPAALKRWKN